MGVPTAQQAPGALLGVDAGASLAKIAIRADGETLYELIPADTPERVVRRIEALGPVRIGATGAGAGNLARLAGDGIRRVDEFAAWGSGTAALLESQALPAVEPYLLVSLGTGTSVMLSNGMTVSRVGGTALGGGTVVGLGALLLGETEFTRIAALAAAGDRRRVDLLVSDIYRPGEIALAGEITAASFGKPGLREAGSRPRREDLAHGIMGLVGENVALICAALAAASSARRIVFGGSTLRGNPALRDVLAAVAGAFGGEVVFLEHGEFAGALGALELAAR